MTSVLEVFHTGGRPIAYNPEMVDRALWEVVAAGGKIAAGRRALAAWAKSIDEQTATPNATPVPSERTIRNWIDGRFRNRYHELARTRKTEIDEDIVGRAQALSIRMAQLAEDAVVQTSAGLGQANGVEASMILRNVAQAQRTQHDIGQGLRGMGRADSVVTSLEQIARELAGMGAAEIVDAEIVDEPLALDP